MFKFSKFADPHYEGNDFVSGYISQAAQVLSGKMSNLGATDEEQKEVREKAQRILANCAKRR
jgi:hypothetical protein